MTLFALFALNWKILLPFQQKLTKKDNHCYTNVNGILRVPAETLYPILYLSSINEKFMT